MNLRMPFLAGALVHLVEALLHGSAHRALRLRLARDNVPAGVADVVVVDREPIRIFQGPLEKVVVNLFHLARICRALSIGQLPSIGLGFACKRFS